MSSDADAGGDQGTALLAMYDRALPQVYGYLRARAGSEAVAEDLTAETFLAAVQAIERDTVPRPHRRVADRRRAPQARRPLAPPGARGTRPARSLPDETRSSPTASTSASNGARTHEVLDELGAHHRAALTLRYLDGLSVPEVADHLDRTVHATEALLVRARNAFRVAYARGELRCD